MTVTINGQLFMVVASILTLTLFYATLLAPRWFASSLVRDRLWRERDAIFDAHGPGPLVDTYDRIVRRRPVSALEVLAVTWRKPNGVEATCVSGLSVDENRRVQAWMALLSLTASWTGIVLLASHGFRRRQCDHGLPPLLAVAFTLSERPSFSGCSSLYLSGTSERTTTSEATS